MKTQVTADAWLGDEDGDAYWAEGVKATVDVEVTDADEIRLGVRLTSESTDAATLYVSRLSAEHLARFLAAASVAPVEL